MKKTYSEKLRDPRWQKKRLEILSRDNWSCRRCGSQSQTLHVHHVLYVGNKNPWDYDQSYLASLCDDCHAYCGREDVKLALGMLLVNGWSPPEKVKAYDPPAKPACSQATKGLFASMREAAAKAK